MVVAETRREPQVDALWFNIRCSHIKKNGFVCNKLLARVNPNTKRRDLASEAELFCEGCGEPYRLRDYL